MPKAHEKMKKRPRSPPSRWEFELSDGDNADAALEQRTKSKLDIRSAWKGKGRGQDVRPPSSAKEKPTLRMKVVEMQRDSR